MQKGKGEQVWWTTVGVTETMENGKTQPARQPVLHVEKCVPTVPQLVIFFSEIRKCTAYLTFYDF